DRNTNRVIRSAKIPDSFVDFIADANELIGNFAQSRSGKSLGDSSLEALDRRENVRLVELTVCHTPRRRLLPVHESQPFLHYRHRIRLPVDQAAPHYTTVACNRHRFPEKGERTGFIFSHSGLLAVRRNPFVDRFRESKSLEKRVD